MLLFDRGTVCGIGDNGRVLAQVLGGFSRAVEDVGLELNRLALNAAN
jgi:hypothetical protein